MLTEGRTLTVLKQRMSWSTIAGVPTRSQPTWPGKLTVRLLHVLSMVYKVLTMHRLLHRLPQACGCLRRL